MELYVREIHQDDNVKCLSLGHQDFHPLKLFLQKNAKDWHINNITKTYVLVTSINPGKIMGFVSLTCSEIKVSDISEPPAERLKFFPAVKIARLAIDEKYQGKNYGRLLVEHIIMILKNVVMPVVGCRYITVDSKPAAIKFYEKLGFILLNSETNKQKENPLMFLDLHPLIVNTISEKTPAELLFNKLSEIETTF